MGKFRSTLVTAAACGAAAVGGGAIANAATSSTSSTSTTAAPPPAAPHRGAPQGGAPTFNPPTGGHTVNGRTETLLTGDVASKVRAAALAEVSGTVERVETNVDDSAPYEAHIVKSDGTQVIVEVSKDFTVHSVQTMGGHR